MSIALLYLLLGLLLCGGVGYYLANWRGAWIGMISFILGCFAGRMF